MYIKLERKARWKRFFKQKIYFTKVGNLNLEVLNYWRRIFRCIQNWDISKFLFEKFDLTNQNGTILNVLKIKKTKNKSENIILKKYKIQLFYFISNHFSNSTNTWSKKIILLSLCSLKLSKKKKIVFKNIKETLDTIYFNSCLLHIQKFLLESEFLNQTPNKMMFEYFYDILTTNTNIFFSYPGSNSSLYLDLSAGISKQL